MLLLTTKFVTNSHIAARIFFICLKNVLKQTFFKNKVFLSFYDNKIHRVTNYIAINKIN